MDTLTRMRTFIAVVEMGGFSSAGRHLGRSKALISKYVSELEDELGARLLNRTTRKLSVTETGRSYYLQSQEIVRQVDALKESIQDSSATPRGLLRVSAPRSMADSPIVMAIMEFASTEPDVSVELVLEDRFVDLIDEGFDVAVRISNMEDSSLIAKRISRLPLVTVASPELLDKVGDIYEPTDLADMPCIIDTNLKSRHSWIYSKDGERLTVSVNGRVDLNAPQAVRLAALTGLGFARTIRSVVAEDIRKGRLVPVLENYEPDPVGVYVVYANRRHLSAKVRAFLDFMSKNLPRIEEEVCKTFGNCGEELNNTSSGKGSRVAEKAGETINGSHTMPTVPSL